MVTVPPQPGSAARSAPAADGGRGPRSAPGGRSHQAPHGVAVRSRHDLRTPLTSKKAAIVAELKTNDEQTLTADTILTFRQGQPPSRHVASSEPPGVDQTPAIVQMGDIIDLHGVGITYLHPTSVTKCDLLRDGSGGAGSF